MRRGRTTRATATTAALLLLVTACGDGGDEEGNDDAAAAAEDDGSEESDGDGSARAVWDGEEHDFSRVVCEEIVDDQFQIRASGADAPDLQVRFPSTGDGGHDFDQPARVEIFFSGEGGTIGDGEGYQALGDDISGVSSDGSQVSGELDLEPDDITSAPEVKPDGGTLEFEMVCP